MTAQATRHSARRSRFSSAFVASLIPTVAAPTLVMYMWTVARSLDTPAESVDRFMSLGEQLYYGGALTLIMAPIVYGASFGASVLLTLAFGGALYRLAVTRKWIYLISAGGFAVFVHALIFVLLTSRMPPLLPGLVMLGYAWLIGLIAGALLWPSHRDGLLRGAT